MPFIVVYDACVLFPPCLRDLLVRLARSGLVQARWTNEILDECIHAIQRERPSLSAERLNRTRHLMVTAVPDCLVTGYHDLMPDLGLPDPNDRHVLAAAIRAGAQSIVTFNLKDFPERVLTKYSIEALSPDEFVTDLIDLSPTRVMQVLHEQTADLRSPPRTVPDVLHTLRRSGLVESVAKIHEILERIEEGGC